MPKGTLGFALWAWQLSFSSFLRSYSLPVSGVMIEFHILELYLAARLVYLLGLITVPAQVRGREGGGGREREWEGDTDRQTTHIFSSPPVFSH